MIKKFMSLGALLIIAFSMAACNPEYHTKQPEVAGMHSLESAYQNGWISKSDLKAIAKLHNNKKDAQIENEETLSEEKENLIKQSYYYSLWKEIPKPTELKYIYVKKYFGVYSGYIVVMIENDNMINDIFFPVPTYIGGVRLRNYKTNIFVWIE